MSRRKCAQIEKPFAEVQVFFVTPDQKTIVAEALDRCGIPQAHLSQAIRRQKALAMIAQDYLDNHPVK